MKAIIEKINQERIKSVNLRELAIGENTTFNQQQEMRKEQQKHWDKMNFFKKLNEAVNKKKGDDNNG